jgi:hypothetical protein
MKVQIVVHILPREIDQCYRLVHDLKRAKYFIQDEVELILDITLNLSDHYTDWENSKLTKDFFIEKFKYIEKVSNFSNKFKVSHEVTGINTVRRNALRTEEDITHFLWIDVDMFINQLCLYSAIEAAKEIKNEYSIISAELIQGWDASWDIISNPVTRNTPRVYHKDGTTADRSKCLWGTTDPYDMYWENNFNKQPLIRKLDSIKLGGGLFNLFSANLLKLIDIPDSFSHYGLDDTFIMVGSQIMKQLGYDINQYVLENVNILEDHWYRENVYDKFLVMHDPKQIKNNFKQLASSNWANEVNKLKERLSVL